MMNYQEIYNAMQATPWKAWLETLPTKVQESFSVERWGNLPKWQAAYERLPDLIPSSIDLNSEIVRVGRKGDCDDFTRAQLEESLRALLPWRKGPFDMFGVHIDTEWRSDWKWNRLKNHIAALNGRAVLDVGAGSGYYCWRIAGAGAKLTIGIEPVLIYAMQFQAMQKYINDASVCVFPVSIDDVPARMESFDTIFSMGLLYHRRAPLDHLLHLKSLLREGGELVLETLVIEGNEGDVLAPQERYSQMANVWFIPSTLTLEVWLKRTGFSNVRLIDASTTTTQEQRATSWMVFQSLADFLDPNDATKTVEGYPAPRRAIFLANK